MIARIRIVFWWGQLPLLFVTGVVTLYFFAKHQATWTWDATFAIVSAVAAVAYRASSLMTGGKARAGAWIVLSLFFTVAYSHFLVALTGGKHAQPLPGTLSLCRSRSF